MKTIGFVMRSAAERLYEISGRPLYEIIQNNVSCQNPSVSVVIPLFNYSKYIYECLDSVCVSDIAGIPGGFEILVIDDRSTDDSARLVEDYMKKTKNAPIRLIKKRFNTGASSARNLGLKLARATYAFMLDADNRIYPNCLSVLYKAINNSGYAASYGVLKVFNETTKKEVGFTSSREWNVRLLVERNYIDNMVMVDRDIILNKVGAYPSGLIGWEDYYLWLKLAEAGYSFNLIPQTLGVYRIHARSVNATANKNSVRLARYFWKSFPSLVEQNRDLEVFFMCPADKLLRFNRTKRVVARFFKVARHFGTMEALADIVNRIRVKLGAKDKPRAYEIVAGSDRPVRVRLNTGDIDALRRRIS